MFRKSEDLCQNSYSGHDCDLDFVLSLASQTKSGCWTSQRGEGLLYRAGSLMLSRPVTLPAGPIWHTHKHQPGLPGSAGAEAAVVDSRSRRSTHSLHLILRGGHYSDLTARERKTKTTQNVYWINNANEE